MGCQPSRNLPASRAKFFQAEQLMRPMATVMHARGHPTLTAPRRSGRCGCHPAIGQQFLDARVGPGWQLCQNILEVGPHIMAIELGRLDQTHQHRSTCASQLGAHEQPILANKSNGADHVLHRIVINRHPGVVHMHQQRIPTPERVIHRLGRHIGLDQ